MGRLFPRQQNTHGGFFVRIAIRLDDITPEMNWEKFERARAMLDAAGAFPLIGVVPRCEDPKLRIDSPRKDFWDVVRYLQEAGWTVALHGWKHVYTTHKGGLFPLNRQSEFAGLSFAEQKYMLRDGQTVLQTHGIQTDLFMAPSHTYDRNTLQAMRESGLGRMTDGFGRRPYVYQGIVFYPISLDRKRTLEDTSDDTTTLVYHCNTMNEADFTAMERVLREHRILPYREYLSIQPENRTAAGHCLEYMTASAKQLAVRLRSRSGA